LYLTTESGGRKENRIRKPEVNVHNVLLISPRKHNFLLPLFYYCYSSICLHSLLLKCRFSTHYACRK